MWLNCPLLCPHPKKSIGCGYTFHAQLWTHSKKKSVLLVGTPRPPCPTNTVSNEHFLFGPYFFGT